MKKIVEIAHLIVSDYIKETDHVADFTLGNGMDALYLASKVSHGNVYGFDIQAEAIKISQKRIEAAGYFNVQYILASHHHLDRYIKENIQAGIFNFGYLPQSDSTLTTSLTTSRIAVFKALDHLQLHGIVLLILYPGHGEGAKEARFFTDWSEHLDKRFYKVIKITMHNKENAPYLIGIEKLREHDLTTEDKLMKVRGEGYDKSSDF